jgi:hypothetical protein
MSTAIKRRRGTTAEHAAFTGLAGEVTVDTDKKTLVVHDGATLGGTPLAKAVHGHAIADTTGLQSALDGKAASSHTHAIADTTGLQSALDGKAASSHTHVISNVTGLQTALDGKAAASHGHAISEVSGLQTALDGKAASSHTHTTAQVTGLDTALAGKLATTAQAADSDKLDGMQPNTASVGNTIVQRNANGDIAGNTISANLFSGTATSARYA